MAERRAIASTIWDDEWFGTLDFICMTLWIGLFSRMADDQGRLLDNAALIGRKVFTYKDIPAGDIEAMLSMFSSDAKIIRYEVEGKRYIQILNWWEHQPMQYAVPSNYPPPPGWVDRYNTNYKGHKIIFNWPARPTTPDGEKLWNILESLPRLSTWTSYLGTLNPNPNPNPLNTSAPETEKPEPSPATAGGVLPEKPKAEQPRTDAKRKGDGVDMVLESAQLAAEKKERATIQDYPPDVQDILGRFYDLWRVPIPKKPTGKKPGAYGQWINDLRELSRIAGGHVPEALQRAHDVWRKNSFTVSHPGAIIKVVAGEVGYLNQRQATAPQPEPEPPPGNPLVFTTAMKLEIRDLIEKKRMKGVDDATEPTL